MVKPADVRISVVAVRIALCMCPACRRCRPPTCTAKCIIANARGRRGNHTRIKESRSAKHAMRSWTARARARPRSYTAARTWSVSSHASSAFSNISNDLHGLVGGLSAPGAPHFSEPISFCLLAIISSRLIVFADMPTKSVSSKTRYGASISRDVRYTRISRLYAPR